MRSSVCDLPIGPFRGQIAHLGVAEHDTARWPIVQQVYGHYMVPWADHRVAVGATVEDVGFAPDATAGGVHEIMREALRVMPGLASATLGEVRVGLRPTSVDDSPILGALPGVGNVFVATGHGANGLLLGPDLRPSDRRPGAGPHPNGRPRPSAPLPHHRRRLRTDT